MPTTPDFGQDVFCTDDVDPLFPWDTGTGMVARRCLRRLMTVGGSAPECPQDGLDVLDMLSVGVADRQVPMLQGRITSELLKDEAALSVKTTMTRTQGSRGETWLITCKGETAAGPFSLVLSVDVVAADVSVIEAA